MPESDPNTTSVGRGSSDMADRAIARFGTAVKIPDISKLQPGKSGGRSLVFRDIVFPPFSLAYLSLVDISIYLSHSHPQPISPIC